MKIFLLSFFILLIPSTISFAEETVTKRINLPGASLEQEITYSTSEADYNATRDTILAKLKAGDASAAVNPRWGPWMRVKTTATIGFEVKGVGASDGHAKLRQISAAEEALYTFEQKTK